ncbi:Hypothetical predicted protein [Olea europaea subsp. europaea]|uniref:Uncharacterized protein n=1 Tax=Olea europaea subsp. europaea TaxID=158383 RepID=A0A8S0SE89_OLEEU|nr:Hypothetical predicted protein [Olea europaea subsp. europaea]
MSGLVDMWNSELAKLRNKGQDGSVKTSHEKEASPDERSSTLRQSASLAKAMKDKVQLALKCSEASVSMLVESFCP